MTYEYWILFVFVAYFAVLISISIVRARQMDNMSDYVLGGRKMGSFTSALSSASSAASGWTMLVFPALAFAAGLIHLWTAVSIALGHWLVWTVMARRLRRYTIAADDSLTLPEFLEKRFADRTGTLRTLSAFITIFFIVFYVSSGLISGAKLLEVVFDLTHEEFHSVGGPGNLGRHHYLHLHRRLPGRFPHRCVPVPDDAGRLRHPAGIVDIHG